MQQTRRHFSTYIGPLGLLATSINSSLAAQSIGAIAFDAFTIFDPRPVLDLAEQLFPDKGAALSNLWRTRQFEYTWLRTLSGQYRDFWQVTEDALVFAAKSMQLQLTSHARSRLLHSYLSLRCWPDVPAALASLKSSGLRLALLSNMTETMLTAGIRNSRLEGMFQHVLSTDRVQAYKPDPRAYRMGTDLFGLRAPNILFVAFAGWDAAGARTFGYPTFWMNRANQPAEELGVSANGSGTAFADLLRYLSR